MTMVLLFPVYYNVLVDRNRIREEEVDRNDNVVCEQRCRNARYLALCRVNLQKYSGLGHSCP